MAYALVSHIALGSTNTNGFTTGSIDTTGANLLIVVLSDSSGASTISDSKGNTWSSAVAMAGGSPRITIFYAKAPTVGTAHTFTVTATALSPTIFVLAFSGADTVAPADQSNKTNSVNTATTQPGSITPTVANSLVISGASYVSTTNTLLIDSGFTITDQIKQVNSQHGGGGAAYLIQTAAAAVNPTWSLSAGSTYSGSAIASFKPAAGVTDPYPAGYDVAVAAQATNAVYMM